MRVTRQVTVEETYELDVTSSTVAKQMLKKAEERGTPYVPMRTRVVKRSRWHTDKEMKK